MYKGSSVVSLRHKPVSGPGPGFSLCVGPIQSEKDQGGKGIFTQSLEVKVDLKDGLAKSRLKM